MGSSVRPLRRTGGVLRLHLSDASGRALRAEFERLEDIGDGSEGELAALLQTASNLPVDLLTQLLWFRAAPQAPSALLISGLPIDEDLPRTPIEPLSPMITAAPLGRCSILLVAILLGEPVAYAAEKQGALVQNIFPTRAERTAPSNESSAVELEYHTELTFSRTLPEQSFDVAAPDFVLLLGLRCLPDRAATTSIVAARDLCRRLDPAHVAVLRQPSFQLRAPHSFSGDADRSRPWSPPLALVRGADEDPCVAFDISCGVRALSARADEALDALRSACADPDIQHDVELAPRDLLVIDNRRGAHARSRYDAQFDGFDRWLLRAYVRHSIRSLRAVSERSFRVLA